MAFLRLFPRTALRVFLAWATFTAVVCLGSIITFLVLMPDNDAGRRGILTAVRAFGPGLFVSSGIGVVLIRHLSCHREHPGRE